MRDYMDRRVTPPRQVTSPTWGPPPPCKQALNTRRNKEILSAEHWLLDRFVDLVVMLLKNWPSQTPNLCGQYAVYKVTQNHGLQTRVNDLSCKISFSAVR